MSSKQGITIIFPFRSFHNQKFHINLSLFFILPIIFNFIILLNLHWITELWVTILNFFIVKLQLDANILYTNYTILHVNFLLPSIDLSADMPDAGIWWSSVIITISL